MYCRQCEKEIPAGAKFCTSCGAPQDSGTTIMVESMESVKIVHLNPEA